MRATTAETNLLAALPAESRDRLLDIAREVFFPAGTRIFEEGERADRFWVVRTGSVVLNTEVPGHRPVALETLRPGDLLGCSWLFPPYDWRLGAEAQSDVRAHEFDATVVRALSSGDPVFGEALARRIAQIIAHRMQTARSRLVDLYAANRGSLTR